MWRVSVSVITKVFTGARKPKITEILEHCMLNHTVVLSKFILDELKDKLTGKFNFTVREANAVVRLVKSRAGSVPILPLAKAVCRDPDDDAVIATAIAGRCACIITGDKDLLDLKTTNGIRVLAPASFWQFEKTYTAAAGMAEG